MSQKTFDPETRLVKIESPFEGEAPSTYTWLEWYACRFVTRHLHYSGEYAKLVDDHTFAVAYGLCDGFGQGSVVVNLDTGEVRPFTQQDLLPDYDWSHVRDSSDEAIMGVARYLVKALRWTPNSIEAMAEKWLVDCQRGGLDPLVY